MNPRFFAIAIFTFLLPVASAFAQTSTWIIDTKHTQIDFQIRRVPVSNVRGSFSRITGTVVWDEEPCAFQRSSHNPDEFCIHYQRNSR